VHCQGQPLPADVTCHVSSSRVPVNCNRRDRSIDLTRHASPATISAAAPAAECSLNVV